MRYVCCLLPVQDLAVSRDFYERLLGQRVEYDFGQNLQFEGGFSLHLASHFRMVSGLPRTAGHGSGPAVELYFEEDNLEPVEQRLLAAGIEFLHRITAQPWQQRVMRFYDPDRNLVEVGESMESTVKRLAAAGRSISEIVTMTSMPCEFIEHTLQNDHEGGQP